MSLMVGQVWETGKMFAASIFEQLVNEIYMKMVKSDNRDEALYTLTVEDKVHIKEILDKHFREIADEMYSLILNKEYYYNKYPEKMRQKKVEISPMLKKFMDLKKKHPNALLLFRCGDFYETYMQDAEKAAQVLGITLTRSSKSKDTEGKPLAMAGFPYHALDTYLPKLIRAGYRVAICDKIE